ncbi:carboxylesterase/lipase family protein [Nesterenkonia sp. CF4.4]|uniref:carboxylesterase/lipase family protein n=1 Tax=Nesterenkonia sp. CF4.4 TaxID=3373079 RepID=UPI003EE51D78
MQEQHLMQNGSPTLNSTPRPPGGVRHRLPRGSLLLLTASLLTAGIATALGWLNSTPWWGWALVVVGVSVVLLLHRHRRRSRLRTWGMWLIGSALVCVTIVIAYPPAGTRAAGGDDPSPTRQVATSEGPVQGVVNDDRTVEIFAGIPYAAPPVGPLRWRAPEPPKVREEVLFAERFSAVPVQPRSTFSSRALSRIVEAPLEGTLLNPYRVSEDSLTLNIWRSTASASGPLPVIVYIPGGGFMTGSGALPLYDGEALASRGDVIMLTINYRLGVLGFMSHPELTEESGDHASGNYGIRDQIAALEWVHENIAAFGGDPDRVTVAGESAGGESVCILGASPLSTGLIHGIIGGSGACMGTTGSTEDGDQYDTQEAAEDAGRRLSELLGGATVEEMRAMPIDRILDAAQDLDSHWRPSVDGSVLPTSPIGVYASGRQHDLPILVGSNADEASLALALPPEVDAEEYRASAHERYGELAERFLELYPGDTPEQALESSLEAETDRVMTRGMTLWADTQTQSGDADAYLYFYSHTPPEDGLQRYGAYHGAEVAYAYDNLGADHDADYTEADYLLRDQMSGYWVAFAREGDPNAAGIPAWPSVGSDPDRVMVFTGDGADMVDHPRADAVDFSLDYEGPIS